MDHYYPYNPLSETQITEVGTVQNGVIQLRHVPQENSISISGFIETNSAHILPNQFRCDYSMDSIYRDANRLLLFNTVHNGQTLSVTYNAVGTPFTANDANEIKDHLEDGTIHGKRPIFGDGLDDSNGTVKVKTMSTIQKGGASVGVGLYMTGNALNVKTMTENELGGAKVGYGLEIDGDGRLNVTLEAVTLEAAPAPAPEPEPATKNYAFIGGMSSIADLENNLQWFSYDEGVYYGFEDITPEGYYTYNNGTSHLLSSTEFTVSTAEQQGLVYGGEVEYDEDVPEGKFCLVSYASFTGKLNGELYYLSYDYITFTVTVATNSLLSVRTGAVTFAGVGSDFPAKPKDGTMFIKDGAAYIFWQNDWHKLGGENHD